MNARIVLLGGDGIGPEVTAAAARVLHEVGARFGHRFTCVEALIGGAAIRATGQPLPADTVEAVRDAGAVLLGAVGDPQFDSRPPGQRPESALLALRRELGVYANLRPARVWPGLEEAGPLKPAVLAGTDLVVVRELTGGLYYGEPRGLLDDGREAVNTMRYSRDEIERIARVAFELATRRSGRVCSVDKANVLEVSRLWRSVVNDVAREYAGVTLTHEYVDAAAMKIAMMPSAFDVILTENMFGDILSDEAGAICGSLGLLPSASLGRGTGLFEPVHGSAPDIAGQDVANPIGAIASAAMLLADGLHLAVEAAAVIAAIESALRFGLRTRDVGARWSAVVGTRAFTDAVIAGLADSAAEPVTRPSRSSQDSEADPRRTHA